MVRCLSNTESLNEKKDKRQTFFNEKCNKLKCIILLVNTIKMTSHYERIVQNAAKYILEDPGDFHLAMTLVKEAKRQHDLEKQKIKRQDAEFSKFRSPTSSSKTTKLVETAIMESYNRDTGDFVVQDIYDNIREKEDDTRYTVGYIAKEGIDSVFDEILKISRPFCVKTYTQRTSKCGTTVSHVPLLDKYGREIYRVIDQIIHPDEY